MDYEDSENDFDEESFEVVPEEPEEFVSPEEVDTEKKGSKKSLEIRRKIEEYIDKKRVEDLHDYLLDDLDEESDDAPQK
jgi:hypothetical protein